ncbi:MAG TPA: sulfatase-like hydrolase/transferase [Thermoanaerobaculia bacterium]
MIRRLILVALLIATAACRNRTHDYRNAPVIIISIDTLRADHLPVYGYPNVRTPAIDALRRDSILFTNAYSSVPLTLPSHITMLTGLLPPDHHVRNNIGYRFDPSMATIPTALKSRGYETGAAISAFVLRGNVGISKAFDFYDDGVVSKPDIPIGALQRAGGETAVIAKQWVGARKDRPFFFFLHLFEPHAPYEPPEPFRSQFTSPYDGEIATADSIVGDFLGQMRRDGTYDRAVIVLMSDHGEGLYEHGEPEHGIFLYREAIHVPLMLKLPHSDRANSKVDRVVGLIDIFPTIASLAGAPVPKNLPGLSLLADQAPANRTIYSETLYPRIHLGWSDLHSLVDSDFHFIQAPRPELYDEKRDPAEKNNVINDERRAYARLRDALGTYGSSMEAPSHVDPDEARKLMALGYLGSTASTPAGPLPDPKDRIGELAAMVKAMQFVRDNRDAEAVDAFRVILSENPRLADAWTQLGTSLEHLHRDEEAAQAYRKAIEMAPTLAGEFGLRLARVLIRLGKLDEAAAHARLAENINYGAAHLILARIALQKNDYATAEAEIKNASSDRFNRIPAEILLAQLYARQNRLAEASATIQAAAEEMKRQHSGPVESFEYTRGDILARSNRDDEAIAAFRREIELFPDNRQTYANLYLVYMVRHEPALADQVLEQMVRAIPVRSTMLFAAHTMHEIGDTHGAAEWEKRARRSQ